MQAFQQGLMTGAQLGRGMRENRNAREIGGLLQAGDTQGAVDYAYGQGDIRTAGALQRQLSDQEKAEAEQRVEVLSGGVRALLSVPAEQRPQVLAQLEPQLAGIFDPGTLSQLRTADLSDQSLQAFGAALGVEAQRLQLFQTRSGDIVGVNPTTGEQSVVYDGPEPTPQAPNGYRWTQEGALEAIPGGPADPRVAGGLAASRRAPPRGSSGGSRRSGGSSRPAAPAAPSRKPWERF